MKDFITLDETNPLIQSIYEKDNIKIRYNKLKNGLCYIYFSSNALYVKDSKEDFEKKIIQEDRFEWINRSADCKPELEIFVRDIWLSWYINGINNSQNSIEKTIDYLRQICKGYIVTTVGVSSGGYMAAITAACLNAEKCFDFSGQFSLIHHFDHVKENSFLKDYLEKHADGGVLEAYRIINASDTSIYYFLPVRSQQDVEQSQFAAQCHNVKTIRFNSKRHGSPVLSVSLPTFLSWNSSDIEELCVLSQTNPIKVIPFSIKVSGLFKTLVFLFRKAMKICVEKIKAKI